MARSHIEFVQCQNIDWQDGPDCTRIKLLNADPGSTAGTLLIQYPAGWRTQTHRRRTRRRMVRPRRRH